MSVQGAPLHHGGAKARLGEELRKYALAAAYLYVAFLALMLYKSALVAGASGTVLWHGLAAGKALVLGKFLLIGDMAGVGTRLPAPTRAARIAWRAGLLLVLLVALTAIEELVVGWVHGRAAAATVAELRGRSVPEAAAECLVLLLVLLPLVAAQEVHRALGAMGLTGLLRKSPAGTGAFETRNSEEVRQ